MAGAQLAVLQNPVDILIIELFPYLFAAVTIDNVNGMSSQPTCSVQHVFQQRFVSYFVQNFG
jgi:hypothetical protein